MTHRMIVVTKRFSTLILALTLVGMQGCGKKEETKTFGRFTPEELLPTFSHKPKTPIATVPTTVTTTEAPAVEVPTETSPAQTAPVAVPSAPVNAQPAPMGAPVPPAANVPAPVVISPPVVLPSAPAVPVVAPPVVTPVVPAPHSVRPLDQVHQFQVLVFPHFGTYTIPQGRESSASSVTITSKANCTAYVAQKDSSKEWQKTGAALESANTFNFSLTHPSLSKSPLYVECEKNFTVNREKTLKSLEYSGNFVAIIKNGTIQIINIVDPELYLRGVVPSEVYSTWPMEVLKVQAVAARTYAWWSVLNERIGISNDYDMDDTVSYQAYTGTSQESSNTTAAVKETNGIMILSNGAPILAYFSSDAGGYTADSDDVFGLNLPYCKAKPETFDPSQYTSAWNKEFSFSELTQKMISAGLIVNGTVIVNIEAFEKDQSGRVKKLKLTTQTGKVKLIAGVSFSRLLSLRSRLFKLTRVVDSAGRDALSIDGRGYGHGVGMSQMGANQFHRQFGWNYEEILNFYYTGVTLSK